MRRGALCALLALAACGGPSEPPIEVRRVQRDLLDDPGAFEVLEPAGGAAPQVGVLTPDIDSQVDAADRLALVLPPPARVAFAVEPRDGKVVLTGAVGVDLEVARELARRGAPGLSVRFEIEVDGAPVFTASVRVHPKRPRAFVQERHLHNVWHPLPEGGIALAPGQRVTLSTRLEGAAPADLGTIRAGFAEPRLERREHVPRARASRGRPNLLLIVMDTQRADRSSLHGYARPTTPSLLRLAERGLVYEAAQATSSWTWPSTASLLTGREPEEHGVLHYRSCWLADELDTLAEALRDGGASCAAFSGNPLVSPWRNFDQGFERFEHAEGFRMSDEVVPPALEWLRANAGRRFFLYLHLVDPHSPHLPRREDLRRFCGVDEDEREPTLIEGLGTLLRAAREHTADGRPRPELVVAPEDARWLSDVYDASVATGDHWVGQVLDLLDELGLAETTVVAYTSDHGEELLDHGLLEHAHTLYQELVHVPLVLAGPGVPRGERRALPVSNRHLAPTLARLCGARIEDLEGALDLALPEPPPPEPVLTDTRKGWWNGREFQPIHGLREGDWVLHWAPEGAAWGVPAEEAPEEGRWRLFDLARDPREQHDLAAGEPERAAAMRAAIARRLAELAARRPGRRVEAGASTLEMLRQVGYLGGDEER